MTLGDVSFAILHPAVVIALAAMVARMHYRARATSPLGGAARLAIAAIVLCAAVIIFAGVRWWLMPSWPSLGVWSTGAAAIIATLALTGRAASEVGRVSKPADGVREGSG